MRGKESVYLSAAALSKMSDGDLAKMQKHLKTPKGGGKYRHEQRELANRVKTERRQRRG